MRCHVRTSQIIKKGCCAHRSSPFGILSNLRYRGGYFFFFAFLAAFFFATVYESPPIWSSGVRGALLYASLLSPTRRCGVRRLSRVAEGCGNFEEDPRAEVRLRALPSFHHRQRGTKSYLREPVTRTHS